MPLLLPVVLLLAVLAFAVLLWAVGLLGRLRRPPVAHRLMPWQLALRGSVLIVGVLAWAVIAWAWHPATGPSIAGGLLAGGLLGAGSAVAARIERRDAGWFQTPHRAFFVLLAALVVARVGWSAYATFAGLRGDQAMLLAALAGLLAGYPLAQAWLLRMRLRRAQRRG